VYAFQTSTVDSFTGIRQHRTTSTVDQGRTSAPSLAVALHQYLLLLARPAHRHAGEVRYHRVRLHTRDEGVASRGFTVRHISCPRLPRGYIPTTSHDSISLPSLTSPTEVSKSHTRSMRNLSSKDTKGRMSPLPNLVLSTR
jgi:hypothetical protein